MLNQVKIKLTGGITNTVNFGGNFFLMISAAPAGLRARFRGNNSVVADLQPVKGSRIKTGSDFNSIEFKVDADAEIEAYIGSGDVEAENAAVLVANGMDSPVPVVHTGTVNLTASNVKINNTVGEEVPVAVQGVVDVKQAQASTLADSSVPVGASAVIAAAASASRLAVRFRNAGTTNLALGGAAVTISNAVVLLAPGEVYEEIVAAAAAIYAVGDAAGGVIKVQAVA